MDSNPDRSAIPLTLPPLREVIQRNGLLARKSLGQHFLLDGNITAKIVRSAGDMTSINAIEIGPGPGGLTRALLASDAVHVWAIERDDRCVAALAELDPIYGKRLTVLAQDALDYSLPKHIPAPRAIIANLPYNIGTRLLLNWLDDIAREGAGCYVSLTLMFQKEVAERLFASPGTKDYGRLSVITQWLCDVDHCFDLPASAFTPPPKVASSVVRLVPLTQPRAQAEKKTLESLLAAAFGQRRKMLRSSLASLSPQAADALRTAEIDPTRRAETLSVEEFCRLARYPWQIKNPIENL
jgi:16S rRNA (adenine1518-N6/adenine1519-N6)-dimethyltransferase